MGLGGLKGMRQKKAARKPFSPFPVSVEKASLVFYFALVLIALGPCLFLNQAYFEGDLIAQNIPYWDFFKSCLMQGHWPLWCPYLFGGQPYLADPNCMVFYPPAYFFLWPSRAMGWGFYFGFHLFLALFGMHCWLRSVGFSKNASRVGAVLYGLSGFFWWEIIHPQVLAGYAWLPWWGLALEKFSQNWEKRWAFVIGLIFAFLFLCGHFQVLLGASYGGAIYFLFRVFPQVQNPLQMKVGWKNFIPLVGIFVWGMFPLLALAIPLIEVSHYSGRIHAISDYFNFNADMSDNPKMLFKFIFPLTAWAPNQYSLSYVDILENAGYLGIWFPFLLCGAFWNIRRKHWVYFWAGCGVLALLLTLGKYTPLHHWLYEKVPGFEFVRAPYRFVYLYVVAGTFLGVSGWEFLETQKTKELIRFWPWVLFYAVVLSLVAVFVFTGQGPAVMGLGLGTLGLWIWLQGRYALWANRGQWLFIVGIAFSMILSGWQSCPSRLGPDSNFYFAKNRPELLELKQRTGLGRTFIDSDIEYPLQTGGKILYGKLPPDAAYSLGIRDVQGYNPLSLWKTSQLSSLPFQSVARLWALQSIAQGVPDNLKQELFRQEKSGPVYLYYAKKPFPYVYAPNRFEVVSSDEERLALMGQKDFNPYVLSYFSAAPPEGMPAIDLPKPDSLTYQLTRDDPDDQVFQVQRKESGWTVFSEVVYPGWKVWVDGKRAPLLTANHVFRAVYVTAGNHEVKFSYAPIWWTPIRAGLGLWFLSVLALFWRPWRKWALGA